MKNTSECNSSQSAFENITIIYHPGLIQIACDDFLKHYLEEKGNGALKLSGHILEEYKKRQGIPLNISQDSLAIEILAHTYADIFSLAISSAGRVLPAHLKNTVEDLMERIHSRTEIIDCGESEIDNNRRVWDALCPFKKIIYGVLGDRA